MKAIVAFDDKYLQNGQKILADDTVLIGLDGQWYEIDLTAANAETARGVISEFTRIGRKVENPEARHAAEQPQRTPQEGRRYWDGYRAWCDSLGLGYHTTTGKFYPKVKQVAEYERWREQNGGAHYHERRTQRGGKPGDPALVPHTAIRPAKDSSLNGTPAEGGGPGTAGVGAGNPGAA